MSLDVSLNIRNPVAHFAIGETFEVAGRSYVRIPTPEYALPKTQIYGKSDQSTGVFGPEVLAHGQQVFTSNITGNLAKMAAEAGLYGCCWDAGSRTFAKQLVPALRAGLNRLNTEPQYYRQFEPEQWGTLENLVEFVTNFLEACERYPDAAIHCSP